MGAKRTKKTTTAAAAPARPPDAETESLTVRMPGDLYRRWNAYAAIQGTTAGKLVVARIERELTGWYTARRGEEPAGEGPAPLRYVG